jgi:AcrR family transcriptional regulator
MEGSSGGNVGDGALVSASTKKRGRPPSKSAVSASLHASRARLATPAGARVAEVQRARLLAGAMRAIDKYGYARTTVSEITALAHVSRRTFYELFPNSEECMLGMYEEVLAKARLRMALGELGALAWRERVRGTLWAILSFLDGEPVLARVCVVQSARGGPRIVELRERLFAQLAEAIDEGRATSGRAADCPELTAEGLVGAVLSILHTRLVRDEPGQLRALQGELMAMIVAPYLGPAAARAERARPAPEPIAAMAGGGGANGSIASGEILSAEHDPLHGVSMRFTYRTACVLEAVAAEPGRSNRGVGTAAGIADQGQVSKLLARLQGLGLLKNTGPVHKGAPNAWRLTGEGEQVVRVVGMGGGGLGA